MGGDHPVVGGATSGQVVLREVRKVVGREPGSNISFILPACY